MVGDVAWHQKNPKLLGSVGDDKQLLFWDTSMDGAKPTTVIPNVRKDNDGHIAVREHKKEGNRKEGRKRKRRQDRTGVEAERWSGRGAAKSSEGGGGEYSGLVRLFHRHHLVPFRALCWCAV